MSRPRRGILEPRSRGWVWVFVLSVLCAAIGVAGGSVWALWSDSHVASLRPLAHAALGFSVTKDGEQADVADGDGPVSFTLGQAEVEALLEQTPEEGALWLTVPFEVGLLTSAGYGMDYELNVTDPGEATIAGQTPFFFPVGSATDCTPEEAMAVQQAGEHYAEESTVTGLPAGVNARQTSTDHWCAAIGVTPEVYSAPATASAGEGTPAASTASDTWWVYLLPEADPGATVTVTLTPTLTSEECPS